MKMVDLNLQIDGVLLNDKETVDDVIKKIKSVVNTEYDIIYRVDYEENY